VSVLAAIIRLVEELDREHLRRISKVVVRKRAGGLRIVLPARSKLLVERLGAEARKEALEECLGVDIEIA